MTTTEWQCSKSWLVASPGSIRSLWLNKKKTCKWPLMVFGHFGENLYDNLWFVVVPLVNLNPWCPWIDYIENIPKTFKEIGFVDNALELQIWSCKFGVAKFLTPTAMTQIMCPYKGQCGFRRMHLKRLKTITKLVLVHIYLGWLTWVRPYWKYQGIDNVVCARALSTGFKDSNLISQICREIMLALRDCEQGVLD